MLVMRGSFKNKKAKIISVDLKRTRVTLENIQRTKKDGTKVSVYFHPSSLQLQSLNLEDQKRIAILSRNKLESTKLEMKEKNAFEKTKSSN